MIPPVADCTLAVLAGGAGSRMGRPKGELTVDGRAILEILLDQWQWDGPSLLVLAPGVPRPKGAGRFTRVIDDPIAGQGPLRGLLTALEHTATNHLIVATVDMPEIRPKHLQWLIVSLKVRPKSAGLVTCRTVQGRRQIESFPLVARTSAALHCVRDAFHNGERSVRSLAATGTFDLIPAPGDWDDSVWINLNFPADLDAFEERRRAADEPYPE